MAFLIAGATLAVTAASAGASYMGQQGAAKKANAAAAANDAANREHRRDVMAHQYDIWGQDIAYANEVLAYSCQSARKRDPRSACKRDPLSVCMDAPGLAGAEP